MATSASGAFATKVTVTIDSLGLTDAEVGEMVDASPRSVARWHDGKVVPQKLNRDRLLELAYVAEALAEVLPREHANVWMFTPNRLLDHNRPADLIRSGEYKRVLDAIEAIADGVFI